MSNIVVYELRGNFKFKDSNFIWNVLEEATKQNFVESLEESEQLLKKIITRANEFVNSFAEEEEVIISQSQREIMIKNYLFELGFFYREKSNNNSELLQNIMNFNAYDSINSRKFIKSKIEKSFSDLESIAEFAKKIGVIQLFKYASYARAYGDEYYKICTYFSQEMYEECQLSIGEGSVSAVCYQTLTADKIAPNKFINYLEMVNRLTKEVEFLKMFKSEAVKFMYDNFTVMTKFPDIKRPVVETPSSVTEPVLSQFIICNYIKKGDDSSLTLELEKSDIQNLLGKIFKENLNSDELMVSLNKNENFLNLQDDVKSYIMRYQPVLEHNIEIFKKTALTEYPVNRICRIYKEDSI